MLQKNEKIISAIIAVLLGIVCWLGIMGMGDTIRKAMGYPMGGHRVEDFPCQFPDSGCPGEWWIFP